jgi:hypothetical protein
MTIPIEELRAGDIDETPVVVEGWDRDDMINDQTWTYFEATRDNDGRTLVTSEYSVVGFYEAGTVYERDGYDDYAEAHRDDTSEDDALDEYEFSALFEGSYSCDGPMMNYWYPTSGISDRDEAIEAAAKIVDLSLCVVEVDGNYGLALTGGGMDLTWEIVAAYVALGQLPPAHFAANLSAMAGYGKSEAHRYIIAACLASLAAMEKRMRYAHEQLTERAQRWASDNNN